VPPTPALFHAVTPCLRSLRRSRLTQLALYAILFALLACPGDHRDALESRARSAAVSTDALLPAEGPEGAVHDPSEPLDHCHDAGPWKAVLTHSSPRVPPRTLALLSPADYAAPFMGQLPGTVPRPLVSGGRCVLPVICRWRL
jgi:hypothetical protein